MTGGRRRRACPPDVIERLLRLQAGAQVVLDLVPRALVLRLFLAPDDFAGAGKALQLGAEAGTREWIQLLDPYQRHVGDLLLLCFLEIGRASCRERVWISVV